ncbi:NAD(P)/FAD-dependent oxidoreductase [Elioraea rosea]|uniref:NAD(P)/FAD-dependent oxidoreductase n=1 Tax=Elioraea rosea TaxID=2492390 RepID=UPI0011829B16|nr:FAD-dependent oxidoreductase [Elioraea rosea]
MSTAQASDAVVIGGGLVGAAIAYGLVRKGLEVVLLDEGDVAYRASRGNFALVWVQGKGDGQPAYTRWTRASASEWPGLRDMLAEATGIDTHLQQPGGMHLLFSDTEVAQRLALLERMKLAAGNHGYEYRLVEGQELRDMLPGVGPKVIAATYTPYDGHVNSLKLLHALHRGFVAAGGRYVPNTTVTGASAAPGDFRIDTAEARYATLRVVLAAGLGNRELAPHFGLQAPVVPNKGQVLVTERTKHLLPMPTVCVRQTDEGTVMLGDSKEDKGFDLSQTPDVMATIARRSIDSFPWIGQLNIVRAWSALRVMSADGFPIYEQSRRFPGAFVANCHSGVTLAAAHALLLAPMIVAGDLDPMLAPFTADRFDVPAAA